MEERYSVYALPATAQHDWFGGEYIYEIRFEKKALDGKLKV